MPADHQHNTNGTVRGDSATVAPTMVLGNLRGPLLAVGLLAGVAGLGAAAWLGWDRGDDWRHFLHSYLVNFGYFLSLSLGGLFFVLLQHVSRAGWSVTVRRLAELLAANAFLLALLFLPILASVLSGNHSLYEWADAEEVAHDPLLAHKAVFLNPQAFALRAAGYFVVWVFLGTYYLTKSRQQDGSRDWRATAAMERLSPLGLLLFAATLTFASFDWLMSLVPHWYSTIFGVYYFSGAAVGALAAVILMGMFLQAGGRLGEETGTGPLSGRSAAPPPVQSGPVPVSSPSITVEHYHDLGKLLFAFVVFWGYIAFSQYLLIWYANIPEETVWYRPRHAGPWGLVSLGLLAGHLLLPFFGLLSRSQKRCRLVLGFWAVWLLAMHWIDVYWLVMPRLSPDVPVFGPIDACCLVGMGGLFVAGVVLAAGRGSLVPLADPRLDEAMEFENA